ncbi:MAG: hypothetical protein R3E12_19240 [Candidatus Eisenbacteria bacterium]
MNDVKAALEGRGYPKSGTPISITDEIVDLAVTGCVADGRGHVTAGGRGTLLSVRALAPLFTGVPSAQDLAGLGGSRVMPPSWQRPNASSPVLSRGCPIRSDRFRKGGS